MKKKNKMNNLYASFWLYATPRKNKNRKNIMKIKIERKIDIFYSAFSK